MLTRLRFKNWRSLRDVEINDLTPITVFIGANSSGKTNILDALYFLRESSEDGVLQAVQNRGGEERVRSLGVDHDSPTEIEFAFVSNGRMTEITYKMAIHFVAQILPEVAEKLSDQGGKVFLSSSYDGAAYIAHEPDGELKPLPDAPFGWDQTVLSVFGEVSLYPQIFSTFQFITRRWQMLNENFMPYLTVPLAQGGDLTLIDQCADNVAVMLDFMQKVEPDLYQRLQDDLQWLLEHVQSVQTLSNEHETRLSLQEKKHPDQDAPTISSGSARLVAMLTAIFALDLKTRAAMPGLVVIEEPDTALNPAILRNFVEQLRNYTEGEHPRQFILTTHNPRFLDYFKPEEVRVVSRGEDGYTTVERIPDHISEIWLDDHTLGEVWMTRSLGGLPE